MSPRFASAITSRPASRAYLHVSSNACIPAEPSASKKASCGLTATQAGAAASMRPRQKRANALPGASPCNSTGSRSSTGSSPRTSWLRLRSTASATRSPNTVVPTSTWLTAWSLGDGSALGTRGQELGAAAALDGPVLGRRRHDDDAAVPLAEVDVAIGTRRARVRGRPQLAKQPQLLERRLELRPADAPLNPFDRPERRLDRRPLPLGAEVRPQPRAQVAGPADVEHLPAAPVEEVDAGKRRRAEGERPLAVHAPLPRRRERDEVADRPRAALLREADQRDEDFRRRLRVGQRAVAGTRRRPEEVCERGEADARDPAGEQRAREPDGVDDGPGEARSEEH